MRPDKNFKEFTGQVRDLATQMNESYKKNILKLGKVCYQITQAYKDPELDNIWRQQPIYKLWVAVIHQELSGAALVYVLSAIYFHEEVNNPETQLNKKRGNESCPV